MNKKVKPKIFCIDKNNSDLKNLSFEEKVAKIIDNHTGFLKATYKDYELASRTFESNIDGNFKILSYGFHLPQDNFYWKTFLPPEISDKHKFDIIEFSFVLFIHYNDNIYCSIGGSGASVIRKYIDTKFGIDIYSGVAKPDEDVVIEGGKRSITTNISQNNNVYNFNQTLLETLDYSEIPTKLKIVIREELKKSIFKDLIDEKEKTLMEVGSYFSIRKKISFDELKKLIIEIDKIKNNGNFIQLSLFQKVKNDTLYEKLDSHLLELIMKDIALYEQVSYHLTNNVIELIHPSKIDLFYEADKYEVKIPYQKSDDTEYIIDRKRIYVKAIQSIYSTLKDLSDYDTMTKKIKGTKILSFVNEKEKPHTAESLFNHITAEVTFEGLKYFRIDKSWYYLEDSFIEKLNVEAKELYEKYELQKTILNSWNEDDNEDSYNKSHIGDNYYVFDKKILDNIELCDLLIIEENDIYFVHVKNSFSASMRDLALQVKLSAKRFINDIKNISGSTYFRNTIEKYNLSSEKKIDFDSIFEKVNNPTYNLNFVMAYNNNNKTFVGKKATEKIELSQSNIAKYCLINTIKEVNGYTGLKIFVQDISAIQKQQPE